MALAGEPRFKPPRRLDQGDRRRVLLRARTGQRRQGAWLRPQRPSQELSVPRTRRIRLVGEQRQRCADGTGGGALQRSAGPAEGQPRVPHGGGSAGKGPAHQLSIQAAYRAEERDRKDPFARGHGVGGGRWWRPRTSGPLVSLPARGRSRRVEERHQVDRGVAVHRRPAGRRLSPGDRFRSQHPLERYGRAEEASRCP